MKYIIQQDTNTNGTAYYNLSHYIEVKKARKLKGLPIKGDSVRIEDHPLLGKRFVHNGKAYIVDYVVKNWHWGYYVTLVIKNLANDSHSCVWWESLGCGDSTVLECIKDNRLEFKDVLS